MKQILIAFDQLCNTLLGGMADETLSARAYRLEKERNRPWPRRIIDAIFFFDPQHCQQSYGSEVLRKQLPKGYK